MSASLVEKVGAEYLAALAELRSGVNGDLPSAVNRVLHCGLDYSLALARDCHLKLRQLNAEMVAECSKAVDGHAELETEFVLIKAELSASMAELDQHERLIDAAERPPHKPRRPAMPPSGA